MERLKGSAKLKKIFFAMLAAVAAICAVTSPLIVKAANDANKRPVVVIDAGHGGEDAGVLGVRTGVKESELNLKVARLVGEYFEAGGFRAVYTRTNDSMRTHPDVKGNKKRADMFARGDIINAARPVAVISIHMNFYSSSARRGAQVFFDKSDEQSAKLAQALQEQLNKDVNPFLGGRAYSPLAAEKYLLSCSPYPTVIAECGFLSNPFDEQRLLQADFRAQLAYCLYQGVLLYLNTSDSAAAIWFK